jgi:hypothetical protein
MVAANNHGAARLGPGPPALPAQIAASSHGALMTVARESLPTSIFTRGNRAAPQLAAFGFGLIICHDAERPAVRIARVE